MIITATRTDKTIRDIPSSAEIMNMEGIRMSNVLTLDELFKQAAGVDLQGSSYPGARIKLNMRGLTPGFQSKRVLVLMDGRRVNDEYQGNVEFALIPVNGIERIEVIRGPASALYGSNAMGGVIQIFTRKGQKTPLTIISAEAGSDNTQNYTVSHGAIVGAIDYFLSAGHVQTDGYTDNSDGTDRDWRALNAHLNTGLAIDDSSEIRLNAGGYSGSGTDEEADREADRDYQMLTYTLNAGRPGKAGLIVRAYRNGTSDTYNWKYPGKGVYDQETLSADIQQSLWMGERNHIVLGGEVRRESVDINEVSGPINEETDTTGVFVQDEILFGSSLKITAGLRNDYNSDFDGAYSPRLGMLWKTSDNSEVFTSVNRAWRAPGLSDRFARVQYMGMTFEGNPDLDPETLMACEIGMRHRQQDSMKTGITFFYNDMEDSFDFIIDPDGVFRSRNATRMTTLGMEAEFQYFFAPDISIAANYSFMEGKYKEFDSNPAVEGNQPAYLAPHKAGLQADFVCPLGNSHSIRWRFVDSRYGDAQNDTANEMDDYMTVDWRTRIPMTDNMDITLNVNNLFDEEYQEFPEFNQPGRTFMAGAELRF